MTSVEPPVPAGPTPARPTPAVAIDCAHFTAGRCRSCSLLDRPYAVQVAEGESVARSALDRWPGVDWRSTVTGPVSGFRNKAKMVVTGTVEEPSLGIWNPATGGVDLRDCPLHEPAVTASLPVLAELVTRARLTPYDIAARRGELKHLLVTGSPEGELMVRVVLRSTEALPRLRKHLTWLRDALPAARVVSVNLQPEPKAVLEGDEELVLTDAATLPMRLGGAAGGAGGLTLHLRPQSFFQTNTTVATALYDRARAWADELAPLSVWDLYCGVGGFALHLAALGRDVVGVEVSPEAVASATLSAREAGVRARFEAADAIAWATRQSTAAELVVVNPPRRGIGPVLADWLDGSDAAHVLYSSCEVTSLRADLDRMPTWRPVRAQVLDMFPHTRHQELLVLLERR